MITPKEDTNTMRALQGLGNDSSSVRLQAALAVGTTPDPGFIGKLIERCAVEPEFYVREMLTWALTRYAASMTVPVLLDEVRSEVVKSLFPCFAITRSCGRDPYWRAGWGSGDL
ncbi:HEAT repeat domain-containing protein, partial [Streptomyces sp. NPDC051020]|uniref:HEAT repeat domain-containing protein n=1 Tax=Streptomyces sp. NPDC051020 TaxID=3155409 RepID=UPI003445B66D